MMLKGKWRASKLMGLDVYTTEGDLLGHDTHGLQLLPTYLAEKILPLTRYFAYVQVAEEEQNLWQEYQQLLESQLQRQDSLTWLTIVPVAEIFKLHSALSLNDLKK